MPQTSPGHAITMRVAARAGFGATSPAVARAVGAVAAAGGTVDLTSATPA